MHGIIFIEPGYTHCIWIFQQKQKLVLVGVVSLVVQGDGVGETGLVGHRVPPYTASLVVQRHLDLCQVQT